MVKQLRSSIIVIAVVVLAVTVFPAGGPAAADNSSGRIDAGLSGAALRLALQDARFKLSAEPGSDVNDYDVYMATDTRGRRTVLILEPIRERAEENHFYKWFFDDAGRTYKAVEMTGTSRDLDRMQAEFNNRRGSPVATSELKASLDRQWAAHLDRKRLLTTQKALRKPLSPQPVRSPRLLLEASESDSSFGFDSRTPDVPYCYGSIDYFTYFEDPIWINVAETRWYIEFDGWDATSSYPNCWAKDPGWWPPPANTQWYVGDCSPGGYNNGGFDLYALTTYNNWDWGDNDIQTGVLMMPGLQYTSYWFNPYVQQSTWGEDANYLTMSTDNTNNYLCWYAPHPNAAHSAEGKQKPSR